ncbi:MAG: DNA replication/repair protein RecF [Bacteroidales bacterium]|nr:DNA replication/repair protein RecF [Bacteroidales bacterium]
MALDRLTLVNFKNYREADVHLCEGVNCFVGNNGAGKTNLLDAVYYLSFCKSHFNPVDVQNIRIGEDYFAIHGYYGEDMASCVVRKGKGKQMKWNKKPYRTLAEHIGRLPLVMVSPADQSLITGGSEGRRRFLDGVLSQTDAGYLHHLMQYGKALEQRNRLLKQMWEDRVWEEAMVSVWDEQLCQHGVPLGEARRRFVKDFEPIFHHYYSKIAGDEERVELEFASGNRPLEVQLMESRQADKYTQYTNVGPHKDDLVMRLGSEMAVKRFGSQGQQKSFALALKLAQFQYIDEHCVGKPMLLLDDVFDKLDMNRVKQLIALVGSERFGQVMLTDTQPGRVQAIFDELPHLEHKLFTVEKGEVYAT